MGEEERIEEEITICWNCEAELEEDDICTDGDGNPFCEQCYDERYGHCYNCNAETRNDYLEEHNGDYYCEECHSQLDDAAEAQKLIYAYEYKPAPVFYPSPNPSTSEHLYLGVELEVETPDEDDNDRIAQKIKDIAGDFIYCKTDGSLDDGFEIVSHPASLEYHLTESSWEAVLTYLNKEDCKSHNTKTCGLHIHVNKDYLTYQQQIRLGIFIHTQAVNITKVARRESTYAKYKKDITILSEDEITHNIDRYEALNYQNDYTVEFRMFRGTLKPETFFATLEFVNSVIGFVKTMSTADITYSFAAAWTKYIAYVQGQNYQYLPEYLTEKEVM